MSGYTKLFSSILASSVWCEDDKTRLVWITMLAMADKDGVVEAAVPGLANTARVTVEDVLAALEKFKAPDPYSRSKDFDGRRIEDVRGGWKLLNHSFYRAKMGKEEMREYKAAKQREYRARRDVDKPVSEAYRVLESAGVKAAEAGDEKTFNETAERRLNGG